MSTTRQGNDFRDQVASLLRAAGFSNVEPEPNINFKNVDLSSVWTRDSLDGPLTYLIEVKNFTDPLPLNHCSLFAAQYGEIVRKGLADRAWLISKGPISAKGRDQIRSAQGRSLDCLTFDEFQRRLFGIDSYLASLNEKYRLSEMERYYIPLYLLNGTSIEKYVLDWLDDAAALPLAIVGAYGSGKTTFALHLAHELILRTKKTSVDRIPILIPLDEIIDEQSIEGLMGKVLASRYRVENYHYHLFSSLNENGRFVLIFDGFDEMKHGMTPSMFMSNLTEIMQLDKGKAKIIILGRNTIFHNDYEFKSIILGRNFTMAGQEITSLGRRPFRQLELRSFTPGEAASFVHRYFPQRARVVWAETQRGIASDSWVNSRVDEILNVRYNDLITRPVHAQMMCEIATDPGRKLDHISQYELYDNFIHNLFDRELRKKGRFRNFGVNIRRDFNGSVARWLWGQGGISTISLAEVPSEFCYQAVKGISHEFDSEALKRELLAGCFVEKRGGTVYFPHRSIQEFLVADHIWNHAFEESSISNSNELRDAFSACTPEVTEFIVGRVYLEKKLKQNVEPKVLRLINVGQPNEDLVIEQNELRLFFVMSSAAGLLRTIDASRNSATKRLLAFFLRNGELTFGLRTRDAVDYMDKLLGEIQRGRLSEFKVAAFLWAKMLIKTRNADKSVGDRFALAFCPVEDLSRVVDELTYNFAGVKIDRTSYKLWLFLRAATIRSAHVEIDLTKIVELTCQSESLRALDGPLDPSDRILIVLSLAEIERYVEGRINGTANRRKVYQLLSDEKLQYKLIVE